MSICMVKGYQNTIRDPGSSDSRFTEHNPERRTGFAKKGRTSGTRRPHFRDAKLLDIAPDSRLRGTCPATSTDLFVGRCRGALKRPKPVSVRPFLKGDAGAKSDNPDLQTSGILIKELWKNCVCSGESLPASFLSWTSGRPVMLHREHARGIGEWKGDSSIKLARLDLVNNPLGPWGLFPRIIPIFHARLVDATTGATDRRSGAQ
ncbi:hypothetical protein V8F20_010427 [Naviculisporaceae sp. PSN 640]